MHDVRKLIITIKARLFQWVFMFKLVIPSAKVVVKHDESVALKLV